jgi:outer membrane protein
MTTKKLALLCSLLSTAVAMPALAQDAGDGYVRASIARTKLVDKGEVKTDGVLDPSAGYETREAWHSVVTLGYFPFDHVAIEGSLSTPATTNNIPAGSLAGVPNLGDDEFVIATVGASVYPLKGTVRPYAGGGYAFQITTQERDGLGVNLNIPSTSGPYLNAGFAVDLSPRLEMFADVRKAWYRTNATGLLPVSPTYAAQVDADAKLDPLTVQLGFGVKFGKRAAAARDAFEAEESDGSHWLVKVGLTNLSLADKLELDVAGTPLPDAGISTFEHQTPTLQVARFLTPNIAVNATLGLPPTIDIHGAGGSMGALPRLGKVTYGPTALTLQYHPLRKGVVRPYAGVGASYMIVFGTKDGAFTDLEVDNDFGFAFEAGAEIMFQKNIGLFLDVKKALLRPEARGTFMGMDVNGQTRLDPWALSGGVSLHF